MTLFGAFMPSLAPDIQAAVGADAPKPTMPIFKRKWWYLADRLDARPVIWSLENKPEDWEAPAFTGSVRHKPSDHFYTSSGTMFANCDCSHYGFQWGQQRRLARAVMAFIRRQTAITQHQFQNHFLGQ